MLARCLPGTRNTPVALAASLLLASRGTERCQGAQGFGLAAASTQGTSSEPG